MRRIFRILLYTLATILVLVAGFVAYVFIAARVHSGHNLGKLGGEVKTLAAEGHTYRDLNKNGTLDAYEDARQPLEARVNDLLGQMTLEEKAGLMFINIINVDTDGDLAEIPEFNNPYSFVLPTNSDLVVGKKMNHFNLLHTPGTRALALWHNAVQKLAEQTRLGIPVTLASDPRHHFTTNEFAGLFAGSFSLWPEPLGFAAIGDTVLMKKFANMARQEYRAVGIHVALHPMADLATEPRWPRINGTFGEDATLAGKLVYAYIKGFQGDSVTATSVACMTKHFSGGGPQKEGLDPHFAFQKGQVYPGKNFAYHLIPFEAAFAAGTAQMMPYYGVPMGQTSEDVGFGFNKDIITGLLRDRYHFDGVVCTDWGLITDVKALGFEFKAKAHGVEKLSGEERMLKIVDAGCDQFGGESLPDMLVKLVNENKISEARIDQSVRRILRDKFRLGLFENPYVDADRAMEVVGNPVFRKAGADAQRRSIVLLKNGNLPAKTLPLKQNIKLYIEGVDATVATHYGTVVDEPENADVAILRLSAPFEPREGFVEGLFHHGDLDFKGDRKAAILKILETVPTVVDVYFDRPPVIPEIAEKSAALLANFGATDEAVLDVIFGKAKPEGKLPVEMPSSMDAVREQKEDVPHDSRNPLYPFGAGLTLE